MLDAIGCRPVLLPVRLAHGGMVNATIVVHSACVHFACMRVCLMHIEQGSRVWCLQVNGGLITHPMLSKRCFGIVPIFCYHYRQQIPVICYHCRCVVLHTDSTVASMAGVIAALALILADKS